ncbi:unnamed protein product [Musa banksii]
MKVRATSISTTTTTISASELLLFVGLDNDVRPGVGGTGEHVACLDLIVVEEAGVRLVHLTLDDLAGAGGAGAGAARVRQADARLLGVVEDVHVVRAVELEFAFGEDQLHLVGGHGAHSPPPGVDPEQWVPGLGQGGREAEACARIAPGEAGAEGCTAEGGAGGGCCHGEREAENCWLSREDGGSGCR